MLEDEQLTYGVNSAINKYHKTIMAFLKIAISPCIIQPDHSYIETRPSVIWMGKTSFGQVEISMDGW